MHPPPGRNHIGVPVRCELLSDFVYSFFEHNTFVTVEGGTPVVNCFQILYIRSLNTITSIIRIDANALWIAFRFCIFVLWTQCTVVGLFVVIVVNCFQILYIRSLNTIKKAFFSRRHKLWIAFRFCIFVLWTQYYKKSIYLRRSCELLSDFVYSFFEHNACWRFCERRSVVNCFQILYIRSLNTIYFR